MNQSGLALTALLVGLAFSVANGSQQSTLAGTVSYLQKVALPQDAEVEVKLEDISLADAPAVVLAESRFSTKGGQVPFTFLLSYDRARVIRGHRYNLRATIYVGGQIAWITDTVVPVQLDGTDGTQRLLVNQVVAQTQSQPTPSTSGVEGVAWKLYELNGKSLISSEVRRDPGISFDGAKKSFGANAGLNSMGGQYTLTGSKIKFGPVRSTMMAGPPELMNQERDFTRMLEVATKVKRFNDKLVIYAGDKAVAKFTLSGG
jgi:putative lipoprotein